MSFRAAASTRTESPDTLRTLPPARPHRVLLLLTVAMAVGTVLCLIGLVVDPRELGGQPLWAKPLKFCLSVGLYALTLAWLIGLLPRRARLARALGTVAAVALGIEMVVIVGTAAAGAASHFDVSTPLHSALWATMAVSIVIVWLATLVLAVLLARVPLADRALTLAVRAGLVIGLVGMAIAFLMTGPTSDQLADYRGVVGAHAVGVPDGGPGLPLLGWSTTGGDLRIPHFVGMHALQGLPLLALGLERSARAVPRLRDAATRLRLVALATAGWAALVALTTWQALRAQPLLAPDAATAAAAVTVAAALVAASIVVLAAGPRPGGVGR